MTASSQYDESHKAAYGRLHDERGDAWCAEEHDRNDDWLQVDLGKTFEVCAVATQGDAHDEQWVETFKVSYSSNANNWKTLTRYGKEVVSVNFIINKLAHDAAAAAADDDDNVDNKDYSDDANQLIVTSCQLFHNQTGLFKSRLNFLGQI